MRVLLKSFFLPLRLLRRFKRAPKSKTSLVSRGTVVFGWAVSAALLITSATFCLVALNGGPQASEIIMALAETVPLLGTALGVLGLALVRGKTIRQTSAKSKKKKTK